MIKLNHIGQKAIYFTSPYESKISLTAPLVKSVKWDAKGQEGVMVVSKENNLYKIFLSPKLYTGKANLKRLTYKLQGRTTRRINATLDKVGTQDYEIGFIYNLRQLY